MRKFILIIAMAISLCSSAFAVFIDNESEAVALRDKILRDGFETPGVTGIGIGACDHVTGLDPNGEDKEFCVVILAQDIEAGKKLLEQYPSGQRLDNVFVSIRVSGKIVALDDSEES